MEREFARIGAGWCNQRRSTTAMPPCEGQTTRGSHQAHSEGAGSPSRCAGGASWRRPCLGVGRGELRSRTGVGSARRSARRPVMGQRRPRRTRRLYPPVQVHQLINFRLALRNAGPGGYVPPGETSVSRVSPAKKKDLRRRSAAPWEGRGGFKNQRLAATSMHPRRVSGWRDVSTWSSVQVRVHSRGRAFSA